MYMDVSEPIKNYEIEGRNISSQWGWERLYEVIIMAADISFCFVPDPFLNAVYLYYHKLPYNNSLN